MHLHKYEKIWLIFGVSSLILFLTILGVSAFAMGHHPPSHMHTVDPQNLNNDPMFSNPGLEQIDDTTYRATIIGQAFGYSPSVIEVPVGSTVEFHVTSADVVHSFTIPGTNVNFMLTPGHVNMSVHTFHEPGEYLVICNEYCGTGHHHMQMRIEVTP
ncbi:cytochrome c oxidase subunit II [Evansella cellulosilytica]|uniref:Cytochrome aa3 subunit 2 n=1 Tax=Evansella cellulosilytica (strain ATCC 21833 / DSM 2522 / FERM P-1141 / JCM 9156 / N-4) TaxID=649639 RepID=E6TV33_EVAC2|nr:cytochrome c oxidase subunit II [Evansella cellulosilytica]ADU28616.1 cytochrome c oxidase subunit II [Evansella cellulosilytica DSM 2522]